MPFADTSGARWRRVLPLVLVSACAAALVVYKLRAAILVGPGWDTYAFLANAAEFAGKGYGYTELHRPPFTSFVVSLLFRGGVPLDVRVIQWVDVSLSLLGIIAAYLMARRRLPQVFAASAALGLLAVQPLWSYLGSGYTDFPSVGLSLCMLFACIKATEDDSRYYAAAGVLFVIAVMTRYTALLSAFPAMTWLVLRGRPFRHARAIGFAAVAAFVAYIPAGILYYLRFNDAIFPFVQAFGTSEGVAAPVGEAVKVASGRWYLMNLPTLIAPKAILALTALALIVGVLGLALATWDRVRTWHPSGRRILFAFLGVSAALVAQFGGAGLIARQVTIPLAVLALWRCFAPLDENGFVSDASALDAAMFAYLLAYVDFHGHQTIQVPRYFITMAFPLLYFVALGWYELARRVMGIIAGDESRSKPAVRQALGWAMAAVLLAMTTTALVATAEDTPVKPDPIVEAARESGLWLRQQNLAPGTVVYSDLWPQTAWYARLLPVAMPQFKELQAFQHELDKSSAEYYLTIRSRRYDGFTVAQRMGTVVVLKRSSEPTATLPQVLYLGKAWNNYLENETGYGINLQSTAGRYGLAGTAFLDGATVEQMRSYDLVTAADFKWRNHADAENGLREYVESGGTLVIDASQNLNGLAYSVANTIMLDTVVRRKNPPADAVIQVDPLFAAAHPALGSIDTSAFVDEEGGPWFGAVYEARPGLPALQTLATVGGAPAIQLQSLGKGRIYWIGYNLVWHAFLKENQSEVRLITAVLGDALASSPPPQ